jgi:hypothetical protein
VDALSPETVADRERLRAELDESGPTSTATIPPASTRPATFTLAPASSPAMSTCSDWPAAEPATSVWANVVLNAFTTAAPAGTRLAASSADEVPSGVTTRSRLDQSSGLAMSMTTRPASAP